jgi:hypothetical protein
MQNANHQKTRTICIPLRYPDCVTHHITHFICDDTQLPGFVPFSLKVLLVAEVCLSYSNVHSLVIHYLIQLYQLKLLLVEDWIIHKFCIVKDVEGNGHGLF